MGSKLQENHFLQEKLPNNKNNIKANYLERWKLESVLVEAQFTGDILIWIPYLTQELDSIASGPGGNSMLKFVLQFLKYFLFLAMRFLFLYLLLRITENFFLFFSDGVLNFFYGPRSQRICYLWSSYFLLQPFPFFWDLPIYSFEVWAFIPPKSSNGHADSGILEVGHRSGRHIGQRQLGSFHFL